MTKKIKFFDYVNVLKHLIIFTLYVLINNVEKDVYPYSTSIFVSLIALKSPFIYSALLYLLSYIVLGKFGLLASSSITVATIFIIKLIKSKFKTKNYEYVFYTAISMLGYILLGDTQVASSYEKRILCTLICSILTIVFINTFYAIENKGLKYKMEKEEYSSIAIAVILIGVGISNVTTPLIWKGLSTTIILISTYVFNGGVSILISSCLGISLTVYYSSINYLSIFIFYSVFATLFCSYSRHLSAISLLLCELLAQTLFNVYPAYDIAEVLSTTIGLLIFCIIPTTALNKLKDKINFFKEKQLVRQTINSNRQTLSNRLYELSGVFYEMSSAFNTFKQSELSIEKIKKSTIKEIKHNVCKQCQLCSNCTINDSSRTLGITKMIDIGLAKGKISLIDMPNEISSICIHPKDIIYATNKFLAEYHTYKLSSQTISTSRDLISKESQGVAEILKGLALESGTLLKYHNKLEKVLYEELLKNGFFASEILIYGENNRTTVGIILTMKEFSLSLLQNVVSKCLNFEVILYEKNYVTEEKVYLSFKKKVEYDAVFGISSSKKDNSIVSGDTHSILRINDEKFLVALSDGMGSGENAQSVSSVSLSLIESFYKAGMNSTLILNTVNNLLTINNDDSFTALDISVINLKDKTIDFIKYGAPYGFIINDGAVKIIEGNTLPLGILEELSPSVAQTKIDDGDMILLLTDGISDAFGSSSEIIDFLRSIPAKNPQFLTNQILSKAISISGGKKNDDMTALAVRIFKT